MMKLKTEKVLAVSNIEKMLEIIEFVKVKNNLNDFFQATIH